MAVFHHEAALFNSGLVNSTAVALNVTVGDTIVVMGAGNAVPSGISDTAGNVYTSRGTLAHPSGNNLEAWTAVSNTTQTGLTITVTFAVSTNNAYINAGSWSGVGAFLAVASQTQSAVSSASSGTVNITNAVLLVGFTLFAGVNPCPIVAGIGFTTMLNVGSGASQCARGEFMLNNITANAATFGTAAGTANAATYGITFLVAPIKLGRTGRRERRR